MPSASSSISVDTVTLPSGSQLSILRHDRHPHICWLSAMELHAHVLCTNLHTLPRNVQLSRKASYRQDLTKLSLPYRIASREELNALKGAGVLSMQAPSSMLMRVEDALKLLKEKGKSQVRKEVKRKWRKWTAGAVSGEKDDTKRGKENQAVRGSGSEEGGVTEGVGGKVDSDSDVKKGGRRQRKRSTLTEDSDTEPHASDDVNDSSSSSGEEEGSDGSDDDDDGVNHANTAARILSSHQFHLLWSTPISPPVPPPTPTPSLSSSPATSPSNSPTTTPTPPLTSSSSSPSSTTPQPSPPLPPFSPLARLKKRPRKSSSPFSLSWSRWLGETELSLQVASDSDDRKGGREQKRIRVPPHTEQRSKLHSV